MPQSNLARHSILGLITTRECNNRCVFCPGHRHPQKSQNEKCPCPVQLPNWGQGVAYTYPEGADSPDGNRSEQPFSIRDISASLPFCVNGLLKQIPRTDETSIWFLGGEPTLLEDLIGLAGKFSSSGARRLGLSTNGRLLGQPGYLEGLISRGISRIIICLHGPTKEIHDFQTGVTGSFDETLQGIKRALELGIVPAIASAVTRSNFRNLTELVRYSSSLGIANLHFKIIEGLQGDEPNSIVCVARQQLVAAYLQRAYELGRRLSVQISASGLLPCLPADIRLVPDPLLATNERLYSKLCSTCRWRNTCPGLEGAYAAKYGFCEIRPKLSDHG